MILHCWVRPRRPTGYVAECLELGIYLVEPDQNRAQEALRDAIDTYEGAVRHFRQEKKPVRLVRVLGYWWKRPAWHLAFALRSVPRVHHQGHDGKPVEEPLWTSTLQVPAWV